MDSLPRRCPAHFTYRNCTCELNSRRLLGLCIGNGEEIAVGIVGKGGGTGEGAGQLRDPVQRVRRIEGLLTQRIDEAAEPPGGIELENDPFVFGRKSFA